RASPVLVRAIRIENLGNYIGGRRLLQNSVIVREWRQINRIKNIQKWVPIPRGLPKARVKGATAGARNVCPRAVEHTATLLVLIEAVIEEGAQKSPGLRIPEGQRALDLFCFVAERRIQAAVLQK